MSVVILTSDVSGAVKLFEWGKTLGVATISMEIVLLL